MTPAAPIRRAVALLPQLGDEPPPNAGLSLSRLRREDALKIEVRALGARTRAVALDLSVPAAIARFIDSAVPHLQRIRAAR